MQAQRSQSLGVATDKGLSREKNEDCVFIYRSGSKALLIVADGMGGENAGEVASSIAANVSSGRLRRLIQSRSGIDSNRYAHEILTAFSEAQNEIEARAKEPWGSWSFRGMGTTLTVAIIDNDMLYVGHIGDSRAYVMEKGGIKQITEDHDLKAEGRSNVLTRVLCDGGEPYVHRPDVLHPIRLKEDSYVILCSDGLEKCGVGPYDIMRTVLNNGDNPQKAAEELVDLANSKGGEDNITVAIAKVHVATHMADFT